MRMFYLAISRTENEVVSEESDRVDDTDKSPDLNKSSDIFDFDEVTTLKNGYNSKVKPLLGAKKCTFGPKYWCSSKESMEECNVSLKKSTDRKLNTYLRFYLFDFRHMSFVRNTRCCFTFNFLNCAYYSI